MLPPASGPLGMDIASTAVKLPVILCRQYKNLSSHVAPVNLAGRIRAV